MKEAEALSHVAEFHRLFQLPILDSPTIPSKERCQLRINLLQEELDELKEALDNNDLVEVADALCDIQYVLSGAILEFGLGSSFAAFFNEVQRSNMSKACSTMDEALQTVKKYLDQGTNGHIEKVGDNYLVYRDEDLKVLKSVNYSPADFKGMMEKILSQVQNAS